MIRILKFLKWFFIYNIWFIRNIKISFPLNIIPQYTFGYINDDFNNDTITIKIKYKLCNKIN